MTAAARSTVARSQRQVLAAAKRLDGCARAQFGEHAAAGDRLPLHPGDVADRLRRTAETAIDVLDRDGDRHPAPGELTDIAVCALDLEGELRQHLTARRARRRAELERSLARLRLTRGTADFVDRICEEAVRGCGLRRVLLSRIRDGVWSPWKMYDDRDADAGGAAWMSATALELDDLPLESAVAAAGEAATVEDAVGDPRVHEPLCRLMRWESFVAAPITPGGQALGLLHADRLAESRSVDDDDRDLLWAFAEGIGRIYERATVLERFEAQRALVREASATSESIMSSLDVEVDLVRLVGREQPPSPETDDLAMAERPAAPDGRFTVRERDVLALMVKGQSNDVIAERLAVTRSTVKSHVRSILRKLGAVNRADAISRYHGISFNSGPED